MSVISALRVLLQSMVLSAVACVLALVVNLARSGGLDLVASAPYAIYVPCPMMSSEAAAVEVAGLEADLSGYTIVDARARSEHDRERVPGSRSIPYHPLKSPGESLLAELKALGQNRILVYGDEQIDSGRLLAAELSAAGCLGVRYLSGGFPAWAEAGRPVERGGE